MPFLNPPLASYLYFLNPARSKTLQVLLDGGLECLWVGTDDLTDLLSVLEKEEGRHGADAELLGDVWNLVDVELVEAGLGVGVGEPVSVISL